MKKAYINGNYCDLADAQISIFDRGFLFGDAIYEVLPVYNGRPHFVDHHIARLQSNLEKIKIKPPQLDWHEVINRLVFENGGNDLQVYIHVTRGNQGLRKHDIPSSIEPTVIAFTIHNAYPTQEEKEKGLTAKVIEDNRWHRCDIKTTSLLANILLNDEAVSSGYETSILMRDGIIAEGSTSNVFLVTQEGMIHTPRLTHHCLPGITRHITLELIKELQWSYLEKDISVQELFNAQEIWITSTTKEIFPVVQLNDLVINQGAVGNYWRSINQAYQTLVR